MDMSRQRKRRTTEEKKELEDQEEGRGGGRAGERRARGGNLIRPHRGRAESRALRRGAARPDQPRDPWA